MGQELLAVNLNWTRTPRTYYLATTSTGLKFIRGSHDDRYTHAVVCTKAPHFKPEQIETYGWCHARKDLAVRNFNKQKKFSAEQDNKYEYELIELQKITAKEVREVKKQAKKQYQQWADERMMSEGKETENTNDNN
jgi:protein tyrosine phosphatase